MDFVLRKRDQTIEEWAQTICRSGQLPEGLDFIPGDRVCFTGNKDLIGTVQRVWMGVTKNPLAVPTWAVVFWDNGMRTSMIKVNPSEVELI